MIFDDKHKKRIDWGKVSDAAFLITGLFGAITAVAEAVKIGMEAWEAVKRNLPEKPKGNQELETESRIVMP
jgi:hypothetical protein